MSIEEWREYFKKSGLEEEVIEGNYRYNLSGTGIILIKNEKIHLIQDITISDRYGYEIEVGKEVKEYSIDEEDEVKEGLERIQDRYNKLVQLIKMMGLYNKKINIMKDF